MACLRPSPTLAAQGVECVGGRGKLSPNLGGEMCGIWLFPRLRGKWIAAKPRDEGGESDSPDGGGPDLAVFKAPKMSPLATRPHPPSGYFPRFAGEDDREISSYRDAMSKQSPIRKLRRDRSRLEQELSLAQGTDDTAAIPILKKKISDLDKEIAALDAKREG